MVAVVSPYQPPAPPATPPPPPVTLRRAATFPTAATVGSGSTQRSAPQLTRGTTLTAAPLATAYIPHESEFKVKVDFLKVLRKLNNIDRQRTVFTYLEVSQKLRYGT
jgi:hypothetical protein